MTGTNEGQTKPLEEMSEREYFACVGHRPGMFMGKTSFHTITAFLNGYDQSAARHGGQGLAGWSEWLIARRGRDCNHAWPGQVLHIALPHGWDTYWDLPPDDDKHAIEVLYELLDEFAAEREAADDGCKADETTGAGITADTLRRTSEGTA
ncbi:hypothetical protein EHYA_06943 [Embleya hyalina]|uniref:Uncharacterized protein n=2 Tax=Embleya hyalina TaxID=516124 RepID=A0A401YXA4_9ACTN|nr:hypothetical protein EHYA_06943 [Embleya hyalina]